MQKNLKNCQENIPRAQEKEGNITNLYLFGFNRFNLQRCSNKHSRP